MTEVRDKGGGGGENGTCIWLERLCRWWSAPRRGSSAIIFHKHRRVRTLPEATVYGVHMCMTLSPPLNSYSGLSSQCLRVKMNINLDLKNKYSEAKRGKEGPGSLLGLHTLCLPEVARCEYRLGGWPRSRAPDGSDKARICQRRVSRLDGVPDDGGPLQFFPLLSGFTDKVPGKGRVVLGTQNSEHVPVCEAAPPPRGMMGFYSLILPTEAGCVRRLRPREGGELYTAWGPAGPLKAK